MHTTHNISLLNPNPRLHPTLNNHSILLCLLPAVQKLKSKPLSIGTYILFMPIGQVYRSCDIALDQIGHFFFPHLLCSADVIKDIVNEL